MVWDFFKRNKKVNPANLYSKEYKDEVLLSIEKDNEWAKTPIAFNFLLSKSDKEKARTTEILHKCLVNMTNNQMVNLDELFRDRTSMDWSYDWRNESPSNLLLASMSEEEKVSILGLCTFHPNGYFREKALQTLANFETGREIPFILLRCNDWVAEVRDVARTHVENRIAIKYGKEMVQNLPIVFKLKNSMRADHSALFEKVVQFLSQKDAMLFLEQGTKSKVSKVRYFCYKVIISSKVFNKKALINYLKLEKEPHFRLILFKEILHDISMTEFNEFFSILKKDKSPKIRAEVLQKSYMFYPEKSLAELEEALLDKSGSIRSIGRFLLKKQNITDFTSFYTNVIGQAPNEKLRGALLGIGEVGNKDHIDVILPFLQNEKVGLIKAAIWAIRMLDGKNYRNEFVHLLNHQHRGVSKEAVRALQSTSYQDLKNDIYSIYQNDKYEHAKFNAAVLLCSLPKWDSIPYMITFYGDKEDSTISHLGKIQLIKWIVTFNRTFTAPDKEQIGCIRNALIKHGKELTKEERKQIEFCIKGF